MRYPILLLVLTSLTSYCQISFCPGNTGDPIFEENFGQGITNGPPLPASVTSYTFVNRDPADGEYTISEDIRQLNSWHRADDHTGNQNGKALIVNASFDSGLFYQIPIKGLCENNSYEFSAFLMNVYNSVSGPCPGSGIPVNVRFQIWDESDTTLLAEGDTGVINGSGTPQWQQFAITFATLSNQTAVILKMLNNGDGGCGNDLAIDDIVFKSCGDETDVTYNNANNYPFFSPITIKAEPDFSVYNSHFYQWQISQDMEVWENLPNETNDSLTINSSSGLDYYRVLVAEDPINVENKSCNSISNIFTVGADSDNDGISNVDDLDDDNDTILDIDEYDGLDPLGDHDGDFIPNYRDTDFGPDANNDGIVDRFNFDGDGVPNHLDLDSDNDGIFDIREVGNAQNDTNRNGQTNNPVGANGLDNTVETDDTFSAMATFSLLNSDTDSNPDFKDIDADADGIVDNIEAQSTDNYIAPNGVVDDNGIDLAYPNGLNPVDTDRDTVPDYLDLNSDNDVRDDAIEGWDFDSDGTAETIASGIDADEDGLDDAYDNDTSQVNPTNGQVPTDFPNVDYNVTPERDWREIMAVVVLVDESSAVEGNDLTFDISLVTFNDNTIPVQSASPIDITFFTTDGTDATSLYDVAISPFDYDAISNVSIAIPAFTETFEFTVTSFEDSIFEMDELFTLTGDITTANTINTEVNAIGTILDNDSEPSISMNNDTVVEGEELEFNIALSNPSSKPVDIEVVSSDFTAVSPEDYSPIDSTLTIEGTTNPANPNLSNTFRITTLLDNLNEPDEEVFDVLGRVTSNNVSAEDLTKTGTILDIDPDPLVVITDDSVEEGDTLVFTLSLRNADDELMRNYLPIDFELQTIDITTTANLDYPRLFDYQSIPALESSITIEIPTINDDLNENTETLNLSATALSYTIANSTSVISGSGRIVDNDIPNLFSPNNDGRSDVFRIGLLEEYPNFKLIIFDRWGGEIYEYSNNGKLNPKWWDGTRNGKPVVEGVYFYMLDYNDGTKKPKTGFIQLVK